MKKTASIVLALALLAGCLITAPETVQAATPRKIVIPAGMTSEYIVSALDIAEPGAIVEFSGPSYTIDQTLVIDKKLILTSAAGTGNQAGTKLILDASFTDRHLRITSAASEVSLVNINFSGTAGKAGGGIAIEGKNTRVQMDNCTVENCSYYNLGGGIYSSGTLALNKCVIQKNAAYDGGGIYALRGATIKDSKINDNTADNQGGGIFHAADASLLLNIENTELNGNSANGGGSIYSLYSAILKKCKIDKAKAVMHGGGIYTGASLQVINSTISNCEALDGGGIYAVLKGSVTMRDSSVLQNKAENGGGIWSEGVLNLINSSVIGNSFPTNATEGMGGGVWSNGSLYMGNCTVVNNATRDMGGGIYINASAKLVMTTVAGNQAELTSGGIGVTKVNSVDLYGCLVLGNYTTKRARVNPDTDVSLHASNSLTALPLDKTISDLLPTSNLNVTLTQVTDKPSVMGPKDAAALKSLITPEQIKKWDFGSISSQDLLIDQRGTDCAQGRWYPGAVEGTAPNWDTSLTALNVDGTLIPDFSSGIYSYTYKVLNQTETIAVGATARDSGATIAWSKNGTAITDLQKVPLAFGANTLECKVTARSGDTRIYTISVVRSNDRSDPAPGKWVWQNGAWYHQDSTGKIDTGWLMDGGKWYYLDPSGGRMATDWIKIDNLWYYLDGYGALKVDWFRVSNRWYYSNSSGVMLTGWRRISSKWYHLRSGGEMSVGWVYDGGSWYYCVDSGAMGTGWIYIQGQWYYFYPDSGAMAVDTTIQGYRISPDGVLQR